MYVIQSYSHSYVNKNNKICVPIPNVNICMKLAVSVICSYVCVRYNIIITLLPQIQIVLELDFLFALTY